MKRWLIGCEYSGIVRDAFSKVEGIDAWSCDLIPTESELTRKQDRHLQMDIKKAIVLKDWDGIILHLPCTKIALCGNSTYGVGMPKYHERLESAQWTKEVWELAVSLCDNVVFENPKNVMGKYIGKRTQVIQPFQFGHLERKETWLWIVGLPLLDHTENVYEKMMLLPKKERERIHYMSPSVNRGHERSRFFTGWANAMSNQWGRVDSLSNIKIAA